MAQGARPQLSVFIAISADGFIARPDGAIDWLSAVQLPGEDYGYQKFFDSVDTLVMGRKTYETALGFDAWPYSGKTVVVMTHQQRTSQHGEEFFSGLPVALVDRLTLKNARRLYIDGGSIIQQFLAAGLIDDLTLSTVPVLLGEGIPLFTNGRPEQKLILESSRSWSTGLTQNHYRLQKPAHP